MILAICVPLLLAAAVPIGVNFSSHRSDAFEQVERYLTSEAARCAASLDGQFDRMAQIARSAAAFVGAHPDMTEEELFNLLRLNIMQDPWSTGRASRSSRGRLIPRSRSSRPMSGARAKGFG